MGWLDHARVAELGDRVVQLECGGTSRCGATAMFAPLTAAFINVLSRKWSASPGCWPGIPLRERISAARRMSASARTIDALQAVSNDHLICDQRNLVVRRVVGELDDVGQQGGIHVHGSRCDQDRSCGDGGGEPCPSEVIDDLGRTHDQDRSVGQALSLRRGAGIFRPSPGFPHVVADSQDVAIEVRGIRDRGDVFTAMRLGRETRTTLSRLPTPSTCAGSAQSSFRMAAAPCRSPGSGAGRPRTAKIVSVAK